MCYRNTMETVEYAAPDRKPTVVGVDPGPDRSAIVVLSPGGMPVDAQILPNPDMIRRLFNMRSWQSTVIAIEMIASYGMPVGAEVFETCVWIGRFIESCPPDCWSTIKRKEVVSHLCNSGKGNDAAVRQALIDRFEQDIPRPIVPSGKRSRAIGNKKSPGPLFGIHDDLWAALAVAVTAWDRGAESSPLW